MQSTSVRVDRQTHRELKDLAERMQATVGDTVALAVRRLCQEQRGRELATPLTEADCAWLDADLG